jgi:glycine cleavage system H protein
VEDYSLRFSPDHLWVRLEDDYTAVIGLTEEPLKVIQDFTSINLPEEGVTLNKDDAFGQIFGDKKNLFTLYSPLSGEVLAVNEDIEEAAELLLEDNYEEGWLIRISVQDSNEIDDLLTRNEYEEFVSEGDDIIDDDDDDEDYNFEDHESLDEDDDDDDYYNDRDD